VYASRLATQWPNEKLRQQRISKIIAGDVSVAPLLLGVTATHEPR
jgi:hypothetical protein